MENFSTLIENSKRAVRYWWLLLIIGIALFVVGILVFVYPTQSYLGMSLLFGWLMLISGILEVVLSSVNKHFITGRGWMLAGGIIEIVLGIILIANPFGAMETLVMAIGVILIVEGAINLLSALYTVLAVRRFAKLHPETQSVLESITGEDLNGDGVVAPDVTRTDAEATAVELDHVDENATVEQEKRE